MTTFKKGDKFIPRKPKDVNEYPLWQPCMDLLNGKTLVIENITSNGEISAECCLFHPDWCEKVEGNPVVTNKMRRRITEKELKIAAKQIRLQVGLIELLINKVRENQVKYNFRSNN